MSDDIIFGPEREIVPSLMMSFCFPVSVSVSVSPKPLIFTIRVPFLYSQTLVQHPLLTHYVVNVVGYIAEKLFITTPSL